MRHLLILMTRAELPLPLAPFRYLGLFFALQWSLMTALAIALPLGWDLALPTPWAWLPVVLLAVLSLTTYVISQRKRERREWVATALLTANLATLVGFLYACGGHTNPLISLLLLPAALSGAWLDWRSTLTLSVMALASYSVLTREFIPLVADDGHAHHRLMGVHLFGMWITFGMSLLVIVGLMTPLALSLRRHRERIAQQRESTLRDERLIALATFAAGAAHQLGTPLSTLSLLAGELQPALRDRPDLQADVEQMQQQLRHCKDILHGMMRRAETVRQNERHRIRVDELIRELRHQFTLLHPSRSIKAVPSMPDVFLHADDTLGPALLNLLDNAARVSDDSPSLTLEQSGNRITLSITDSGPGLPAHVMASMGEPFLTSSEGMGLGLFLSNATIARLGGEMRVERLVHGTCIHVHLPLHRGVEP